ncbi:MAG: NPCBM/NEW2 domain-containing protein [Rikenellaceae bacterium]
MYKKSILTVVASLAAIIATSQNRISISDLDLSLAYQSYGVPMKNSAVTAEALSVASSSYANGVGVQSRSIIKLLLSNGSNRFAAKVGVNDCKINYKSEDIIQILMTDGTMVFYTISGDSKQFIGIGSGDGTLKKGCVEFIINGDGKELWSSGLISSGDKPKDVDISVEGINILELVVEDSDNNLSGDHANWMDAIIDYSEIKPQIVGVDYLEVAEQMNQAIQSKLEGKISQLKTTSLIGKKTDFDWLISSQKAKAEILSSSDGKNIVLSNGLVSRVFRVFPNLATIDFQNLMTGENMLRAVSSEGVLTINGKEYSLGGLDGQEEFGYTQYDWVDKFQPFANSFRVVDFKISTPERNINWANERWALVKDWNPKGKQLTFFMEGPRELNGIKVKLHYVIYDEIPVISKWFEIENQTQLPIKLNSFVLEQLAMVEPESPVELTDAAQFRKPNIHVESDWAFHGFTEKESDKCEYWEIDSRYTSQCNYPLLTPCLLEIKLPMGPSYTISNKDSFRSFRTWIMPFDSDDRERKGLFLKRMYHKIAPWTTENPIFMHCTSSDPKTVKEAINQCAETGYEMVILSFGSGLNMEDESEENYTKFRKLREYADSMGVDLGGYSLLSSRWISDEVDVINPETLKRGGMIFGSSPCLCSDWGYDYFRKIKKFYEKTGMKVFENDGSYPGNVCASTEHTHHDGLEDSQWKQREQIESLYQWMNENGIYMNVPDYGYLLNGSNKVGIGYREVNWSLPRERQLVLGRQVMYDGLWERLPAMCWTFVPLTQYHGGGAAATLEPLDQHLETYKAHMMQNYGTGVQACYRGHRLYDTERTKLAVIEIVDWYKRYRDILNSDIIHLRRADGRDWDGIMHISPTLKERGFVMLYNPTNQDITRTISLPLYYTGLTDKAKIREQEGKAKSYKLNREYEVEISVTIPANGNTWLVIEE